MVEDCDVADALQAKFTVGNHKCHKLCTFQNPSAVIVLRNNTEIALWAWEKPKPNDVFVRRITNIYICDKYKKVHLCTPDCKNTIMNSEHCMVCMISGLQWNNDTERTRSWKNAAKCLPSISTIKSDPNKFCRDSKGIVLEGSQNLTKQACMVEANEMLNLMLFSQIRKQSEFSKYLEGRNNANKRINKYAKHCTQNDTPINICTMSSIYVATVFKQPNFFRTQQKIDTQDICNRYTSRLIHYWNVLMPTMEFKPFAISCLYLMRGGIVVNDMVIIQAYPELEQILPEASTLDLYGFSKASFTHNKNMILKSIRHRDTHTLHTLMTTFEQET